MFLFGGRAEANLMDGQREVLPIVEAIGQHLDVRCNECRLLGELSFEKVDSFVYRSVE